MPSYIMVFLGIEVNTLTMTLRIPDNKLREINSVLEEWQHKKVATKKQVEQLVGMLNFTAGCIKPGRIYFSRILNFLREMEGNRAFLTREVKQDIA